QQSSPCTPPTTSGMSCISCATTFRPKWPYSPQRVFELRKSRRRDGVQLRKFSCPEEPKSVSTNRATPQLWQDAPPDSEIAGLRRTHLAARLQRVSWSRQTPRTTR